MLCCSWVLLFVCLQSTIGTTANPPYAEARKIYVDGRHSFKNDGTIRTLRGEEHNIYQVFCVVKYGFAYARPMWTAAAS
jgi:hypothetical protein